MRHSYKKTPWLRWRFEQVHVEWNITGSLGLHGNRIYHFVETWTRFLINSLTITWSTYAVVESNILQCISFACFPLALKVSYDSSESNNMLLLMFLKMSHQSWTQWKIVRKRWKGKIKDPNSSNTVASELTCPLHFMKLVAHFTSKQLLLTKLKAVFNLS